MKLEKHWPDVAEDYQEFDVEDLIDLTAQAQGDGRYRAEA